MILSDNAPGTQSGEAMRAAAANAAAAAASAAASPAARAQVIASQEAAKAQQAAAARFAPAPAPVTSTFNTKMTLAIGGLVAAAGVVGYFVLRKSPRAALAGIDLGLSRKDHLEWVQRAYAVAKRDQQAAYESAKCPSALSNLNAALMATARAEAHMLSATPGQLGRQTGKLNNAISALRKRLAQDFRGALGRCALEYPR